MPVSTYTNEIDARPKLTYQPSPEDARLIRMVEERMESSRQSRRSLDEIWIESVAMTIGKQWHSYNWSTGSLYLKAIPNYIRLCIFNLIRPKVAQIAAALAGDVPQLDVDPMSNSEADKQDARTGQDLLKYLQVRLGWDQLFVGVARWLAMTGTCFVKMVWDPFEMDLHAVPQMDPNGNVTREPMLDEQGQPIVDSITGMPVPGPPIIKGEPARIGQIKSIFCAPFECYTQPGLQNSDEIEWIIHSKLREIKYIDERYPEYGKYVQPGQIDITGGGYVERRVSDILSGNSNGNNLNENFATVLEYWRKPCKDYPRGQLIVVSNGVLLRNDTLPYEHLIVRGELPFVPFVYEPFELRIWGQGFVESVIQIQRDYNLLWSRIFSSVLQTSWPKIIINAATQIRSQGPTDQPGEKLTYVGDPGLKPEWWVPPPLSPLLTELLDRMERKVEDLAYRHQVSSGSHVAGLSAGVSIQLEQEADNQAFGPIRTLFHASMAKMGMHALSLARQFYDEDRLGYLIGDGKEVQLAAFNREQLPDYANVKPSAVSATAMSRAAKQQMLFDLYDRGIFGPKGSPVANKTILERLEFGNVSEMVEEQQAAAVEQQRNQMAQQQAQGAQQQALQGQKHSQAMEMADRSEGAQLQRDGQRSDAALTLAQTQAALRPPPAAPQVPR